MADCPVPIVSDPWLTAPGGRGSESPNTEPRSRRHLFTVARHVSAGTGAIRLAHEACILQAIQDELNCYSCQQKSHHAGQDANSGFNGGKNSLDPRRQHQKRDGRRGQQSRRRSRERAANPDSGSSGPLRLRWNLVPPALEYPADDAHVFFLRTLFGFRPESLSLATVWP